MLSFHTKKYIITCESITNSWWNPSDKGKLEDTNGKGYVFKDGKIYFYTGLMEELVQNAGYKAN
ncbi:MAG: hypothetical protein WBA54_03555 [Acidaminobacteraceae bacterium]